MRRLFRATAAVTLLLLMTAAAAAAQYPPTTTTTTPPPTTTTRPGDPTTTTRPRPTTTTTRDNNGGGNGNGGGNNGGGNGNGGGNNGGGNGNGGGNNGGGNNGGGNGNGGGSGGGGSGAGGDAEPTTQAPPPPTESGEVSDDTPESGDEVVVSSPPSDGEATFDSSEPISAGMSSADGEDTVAIEATVVETDDGTTEVTVTVPEGTPDGLYYIFVIGTDASGNERVIVVAVVVRSTSSAAGVSSQGAEPTFNSSSSDVAVPPVVKALQVSMSPTEIAKIEDDVLHRGATMTIKGNLLVAHRPEDAASLALVAVGAIALAGGSFVLVRRQRAFARSAS